MFSRILIIVLLAALVTRPAVFSQTFPFKTYTTADGLAQSAVSCFFQDSRGYMWFGTWGGLSRYDGRDFWSYRNSAFRVTSIGEGTNDTLWIGTTAGLARLARGDTSFHWTKNSDGVLPSDYIISILKDKDSNMWVGTDKGLAVFTPSGTSAVFDGSRGLQDEHITALRLDSSGAILVSSGRGIMRCRLGAAGLVDIREVLTGTIIGQ